MPQRRNEVQSLVRQEPFAYTAAYNASNQVEYEAWAEVGALFTDNKWICCKHTYDVSENLSRTQWGTDANGNVGYFTCIIGSNNTTAGLLSSITYV